MSNPTNPPPPTPSATQQEELERRLLDTEHRVTALQESRDQQVAALRKLERKIGDFGIHGMRETLDGESPERTRANMARRIQEVEGDLKEAKADRDSLEGRIERIRNRQDAQRAQRTSFIVSILGLLVGALGVVAALVGVCGNAPQKDEKAMCVPGVSGPAVPQK